MAAASSHRGDLIDLLRENTGGYDFHWSFGGGTAMMIQIGHRESDDIDIFLDDAQLLGFLDPSRTGLRFDLMPSDYQSGGSGRNSPSRTSARSILLFPAP
ncbi:nucleotidyl transferase AbiEii/AbiGii toxin family protein [Mesorhizobium sp.]|uniref:nucleotidyl transferase AbiEii/AbiGii toxin family protein n=1 Tax=Mesorhizobium sp. TaxID=1871066 RepID=UPI0025BB36D5|nr:nucleotidyl transferase AbiEii/AbiGii toxin family protein [Mesorhizobium sp.]